MTGKKTLADRLTAGLREVQRLATEIGEETGIGKEQLKRGAQEAAKVAVPVVGKVTAVTSKVTKRLVTHGVTGLLEDITSPAGNNRQPSTGQKVGSTVGTIIGGTVQRGVEYVSRFAKGATKDTGSIEKMLNVAQTGFDKYSAVPGNFNAVDNVGTVQYAVKKEDSTLTIHSQKDSFELTLVHYLSGKDSKKELETLSQDLITRLAGLNQSLQNYSHTGTLKVDGKLKGFLAPQYNVAIAISDEGLNVEYIPAKEKQGRFGLKLKHTQVKGGQQ